jgi:DNA polymerase-3 subunit delta'
VQADPPELRPDGTLAHPWGRPGHPDARFIGYATNERTGKPRTEIVIDQVRALSQAFALTPQMGVAQVALVEPADTIGHAAANALLKTLEEPQPGRYLWLVASEPARLPATIRSRCQKLEFRLPPRDEALAWLRAQGHDAKAAGEALDAARGHPGQAHAWLAGDGLAVRREVAKDLDALARGDASAVATAQRWTGDGQAALRLRFAADLALERTAQAQSSPDQADHARAPDLTASARTRRLATWFDAANRTAALLRTQVRADLAVAELLLAWPQARGAK